MNGPFSESFDCFRSDGLDLAGQWLEEHENSAFIKTQAELINVDPETTDYLLGAFSEGYMQYDDEIMEGRDPTITEMTTKAIEVSET